MANAAAYQFAANFINQMLRELRQDAGYSAIPMGNARIDTARVVEECLGLVTRPTGHQMFLRYALGWIRIYRSTEAPFEIPTDGDFAAVVQYFQGYDQFHRNTKKALPTRLNRLGEHIIRRFIFPMSARPSSTPHSDQNPPSRPPQLRVDCLQRDRNRCVVTDKFNWNEAARREDAGQFVDDEGQQLQYSRFGHVEVAHIIPHTLGWRQGAALSSIRNQINFFTIASMFYRGGTGGISGHLLDRPSNAITLDFLIRIEFGELKLYFEASQGQPNTYTVRHVRSPTLLLPSLPRVVTLRTASSIPLPDPRLLEVHRACALIAHASGAGEALMDLYHDADEGAVRTDGLTPLALLVSHRLMFNAESQIVH